MSLISNQWLAVFIEVARATCPRLSRGRGPLKGFSLPFPDIAVFRAELRTDEDYLPAGIQELLIIRLVMNLSQRLGCGTIEFEFEYVDVLLRLRHGVNAADARSQNNIWTRLLSIAGVFQVF